MNRFKSHLVFSGLVLLIALLTSTEQVHIASAAPPQLQGTALQNPGLEGPYSSGAANAWGRWHQELNSNPKPAECGDRYLVQPKWEPEYNTAIIRDGGVSQHVGNQFDTWRAGVMQNVNVAPGSRYRFSFWSSGRASNDQYPVPSDTGVSLGVRAGIDPNGSGVWSDADVVWGPSGSPHMAGGQAAWQQFSVEATATGSSITVFIQADTGGAGNCRAHLDVWFDSAELVEVGPPPTNTAPPPPPPPPVTNTPVPPTATATPEETPTNTPEPTPVPTDTPEPPQGGVICVNAFTDNNASGVRDPDEGYMAGVALNVVQDGTVIAQGVSPGSASPVCFQEIPEGSYIVGQEVPRSLEMTTAQTAEISVVDGSSISLEFGSRIRTTTDAEEIAEVPTQQPEVITPDQESTAPESGDGLSTLAIVGLAAIVLAVLLLGALVFVMLRQQRS